MITKNKSAEEIRQMWQVRALVAADGKLQRVILIAIAKEYLSDLVTFLRVAFGKVTVPPIVYSDYAAILPNGHVACEMKHRENGIVWKGFVKVYDSEGKFLLETRRLADKLKLNDADRVDMFRTLSKWIARDLRLNIHGEKQVS